MNRILEFTGCKLAIRVNTINAIDIDPEDKKTIRVFMPGVHAPSGYCLHNTSEEAALKIFNDIVKLMKEEV